jgi:putative flippase GtrA
VAELETLRLSYGSPKVAGFMRVVVREALRYTAVSGCAFLIDIIILFVLVHYFSWWYLAAATFSFSLGLLFGYTLSITLVFKYRRVKDRRLEFASFAAIGIVGAAINAAAISFGVNRLGLYYLLAKCGAAGLTFVWGFVTRRQLLFVPYRAV